MSVGTERIQRFDAGSPVCLFKPSLVRQMTTWKSTLYIGFAMKKFINRPEDVVEEMIQGMVGLTQVRPVCRDTRYGPRRCGASRMSNRSR